MPQVTRRLFLQVTGWAGGVAVAAAKPPKVTAKTLTDRGRAGDRLTLPTPPGGGYAPGYEPGY